MRFSRWLFVGGANLLIVATILGVCELGVRLATHEYTGAYFTAEISRGHQIYLNERWGHRVRRNQVDKTLTRQDPAEFRVLFVGDSVTFGYGLPFEQSYHQIARQRLRISHGEVEIDGLGRLNSNLAQLMNSHMAEFVLTAYRPTHLIYQFNVNDVRLSFDPKIRADELTLRERFERFRISVLNRSAFLKLVQATSMRAYMRSQTLSIDEDIYYSPTSNPDRYGRAWNEFESSLGDIDAMLAGREIKFHVMLVPESFRVSDLDIDNDFRLDLSPIDIWPGDRVTQIASHLQIPVFDTLPVLQKYRRERPAERLYFPNDNNHPNQTGHRVISNAVEDYLSDLITGSGEWTEQPIRAGRNGLTLRGLTR